MAGNKISASVKLITVALISLNLMLAAGSCVQQLNEFYKFDYNILLFNDPVQMLHEGNYDSSVPKIILLLKSDDDINQQYHKRIALSGGNNCIVFVFMGVGLSLEENLLNDTLLEATEKLSYWNVKIKIGFIVTGTTRVDHEERKRFVKNIFAWSSNNLIVNVFVLYVDDNQNLAYTYNPYKSKEIVPIEPTELWMYFQDKSSNLFGHQLHISFLYEDTSIRYTEKGFESRDGKMCEYILNGLNATYRVTFRENIIVGLYERLITNGSVDFTPRRYDMTNIAEPGSRIFTYPVTIDSIILMVPSAKPYNQFQGFMKNFTVNNSIVLIAAPIILIIVIFWIVRRLKSAQSTLFQSVVDVISLFFTLDIHGEQNYSNISDRLFILSLSFGGFFFTNGVLSVFISLLTQPVMQAEINTFDQFDKTSIKIAVPSPVFTPALLKLAAAKGKDWSDRVEEKYRLEQFIYQMYSYNTKYAYFLTRTRTDVLIERQKHLSLRGYHIPKEYFTLALSAYFIGSRAPFKERVDQLIHQAFSAGLYDKWNRDTYPNLIKAGYFKKFDIIEDDPEEPVNILVIPVFGWILSSVVFLFEVGYVRLKKYRRRIKGVRRRNAAPYISMNEDGPDQKDFTTEELKPLANLNSADRLVRTALEPNPSHIWHRGGAVMTQKS